MKRLIAKTLQRPYFRPNADGVVPIPTAYRARNPKLLLLLGENASGKSVFRRLLVGYAQEKNIFAIHLSLEGRCNSGIGRIYGSEQDDSTGANSVKTFLGALRTSQASERKHLIMLDEPELGLSESWAASLGAHLGGFLNDPPENLMGVALVSHSKVIVQKLLKHDPSTVMFGYPSLASWLEAKPEIRPLESLSELNHARFKLIHKARPHR